MVAPFMRSFVALSLTQRAEAFLVYGKYRDTQRYLNRAIAIDPDSVNALEERATLLSMAASTTLLARARAVVAQDAATHPNDDDLWWSLALLDARLHQPQQAADDAQRALALKPNVTLERFREAMLQKAAADAKVRP
jgi:tetratricopeptide (TPR) repeat protein